MDNEKRQKLVERYEEEYEKRRLLKVEKVKYNEQIRELDSEINRLTTEEMQVKDRIRDAYNEKRRVIEQTYRMSLIPINGKNQPKPFAGCFKEFRADNKDKGASEGIGCLSKIFLFHGIAFAIPACFASLLNTYSYATLIAYLCFLIWILLICVNRLVLYRQYKKKKEAYLDSLQKYEENKEKNSQLLLQKEESIHKSRTEEKMEIEKCTKKYTNKRQEICNHKKETQSKIETLLKEISEQFAIETKCKMELDQFDKDEALRIENERRLKQARLEEEARRIAEEEARIFAAKVEEYSEKVILASEGYRDLIEYSANIFVKVIKQQKTRTDEQMIYAELTYWVQEDCVYYKYAEVEQTPSYSHKKKEPDQFVYSLNGKKNIVTEAERQGLAWALSTLIIREMNDLYPDGVVKAVRKDNQVILKYSAGNPDYVAPQNWV